MTTKVATFIGRHRRGFSLALCILVYGFIAIALYLPTGPLDNARLPNSGFGDPDQMTWFLGWTPYAIGHWSNLFSTNLVDYPTGINLANNTSVPLLGLIGAPVTLLVGPVASFNFLLRLALLSSSTSMLFVVRTWCRRLPSAFVGGLLYGFGPYLTTQAQGDAHLNLAFGPLPPLIMWCLYELVIRQRRRPVPMGLLLGTVAGAQALIDPEVLTVVGVVSVVGILIGGLVHRATARRRWRHLVTGLGAACGIFVVLAGDLLYYMLIAPGHLTGPVQSTANLQSFANDLLSPIAPTSNQWVAPGPIARAADRFVAANLTESGGYLGIPLVGAWLATALALRRDPIVRIATGLAGIAFIVSLGGHLTVDGLRTALVLPEALFVHLPLLQNTVPARYSIAVALSAAVVVSAGLDHLLAWIAARGPTTRHWMHIATSAGVFALLVTIAPELPIASASFEWPSSLSQALATIPTGSVVLTYPYPIAPWSETMLWQAEQQMSFRIVGGYATVQGPDKQGQFWPPLVYPDFVQEFLVQEQNGRATYYPPYADAPGPTGSAALCQYLSFQSVDAVVYWQAGPGFESVRLLFTSALGQPTYNADGLAVWLNATTVCH